MLAPCCLHAKEINISNASIMVSSSIKEPVHTTIISMLKEEINKRTNLKMIVTKDWKPSITIAIVKSSDQSLNGIQTPALIDEPTHKESYRIEFQGDSKRPILWLIGTDERGVLYAAGHLLRMSVYGHKRMFYETSNSHTISPIEAIRGHQLGYRLSSNTYDLWSCQQYEQYIRELVIFGTNSIETIPLENTSDSLFKTPKDSINSFISHVCMKYDLDYCIWTPEDVDLSDSNVCRKELIRNESYYRECPKLNNVFVPGGDPGNNHPRYLLPFLKKISLCLKKYHPEANLWISLQGFNDEEIEYFFKYINVEKPNWLYGIVCGPGSPSIEETRNRLPRIYKLRHYPDITHCVRCQYPTLKWDQAFALTYGREPINPQPNYYASIHDKYATLTDGFISYSEGVNDDVNKIVWSMKGWEPSFSTSEIISQYDSFFFGTQQKDSTSEAILELENNWIGAIASNLNIERTFHHWQKLEKSHPELKNNWRWQMLVLRAYYDTYTRRRKIYEQQLEDSANLILSQAEKMGSKTAMRLALEEVNKADRINIAPTLRQRIDYYCNALYHSIGWQSSVKKYNASGEERGCILDFVDYPLNNRWWLSDEFDKTSKMSAELTKLDRLKVIATWEHPDNCLFYDDISNIAKSPHVTTTSDDATDVAWWDNGLSRRRLSTQLFQNFPILLYSNLPANANYIIRVSGYGDALLRVNGKRIDPLIYNKNLETFKEFFVSQHYIENGKLVITFDEPEESQLNWRQHSKICEVWLLKAE